MLFRLRLLIVCAVFACCLLPLVRSVAADFSLHEEEDGMTVNLDGELFTRYLTRSHTRPVLWPVIGPTGDRMTRGYPLGEGQPDESRDHVHHRSIWIGYEGVNGYDFWQEKQKGATRAYPAGEIRHREFAKLECPGETATIVTKNDWLSDEGKKICEDERTWQFGTDGENRWLDCRFVLTASEGELRFADSKEGFFAVRVPHSMTVDSKRGGRIENSRGQTDAAAWAQSAEWVDYTGPVRGKTVGIAILEHPESFNYPGAWHVRTYGLFAANPLAKIAFGRDAGDIHKRPLRLVLQPGDTLTLRHRIVLHEGDTESADVAAMHADYLKQE